MDNDPLPGEPRRAGAAQHLERDRDRPHQLAAVTPEEINRAVMLHLLAVCADQPDPCVEQRPLDQRLGQREHQSDRRCVVIGARGEGRALRLDA